jgi:cytochrome c oxidase cbb3-type subunit 1
MHFFFSAYGIVALAFGALFGGVIQGRAQEAWLQPWETVTAAVHPYTAVSTFAWCVILFSNIFFFLHLAMMWLRLGRLSASPTMLDSPDGFPVSSTPASH